MFTTFTKAGVEIILNPAHIAAVTHNPDECRVELCTGKTYSLPAQDWPKVRAALNGDQSPQPAPSPAWIKEQNDDHNTKPPKTFTPLY